MSGGSGSGTPITEPVPSTTTTTRRPYRTGISRTRYTHKLTIHNNISTLFSGFVSNLMIVSTVQPSDPFKLELKPENNSDIIGVKISGIYNGVAISENITLDGNDSKYSSNSYSLVQTLVSKSYSVGSSLTVLAIDDAYQPIFWQVDYGPYQCVFSTVDGMSAGIRPEPEGLRTTMTHYVRLPYKAPVYKNMEFSVTPGYDEKTFVPITDFDVICIPPIYLPSEWAFRCTEKMEE